MNTHLYSNSTLNTTGKSKLEIVVYRSLLGWIGVLLVILSVYIIYTFKKYRIQIQSFSVLKRSMILEKRKTGETNNTLRDHHELSTINAFRCSSLTVTTV